MVSSVSYFSQESRGLEFLINASGMIASDALRRMLPSLSGRQHLRTRWTQYNNSRWDREVPGGGTIVTGSVTYSSFVGEVASSVKPKKCLAE